MKHTFPRRFALQRKTSNRTAKQNKRWVKKTQTHTRFEVPSSCHLWTCHSASVLHRAHCVSGLCTRSILCFKLLLLYSCCQLDTVSLSRNQPLETSSLTFAKSKHSSNHCSDNHLTCLLYSVNACPRIHVLSIYMCIYLCLSIYPRALLLLQSNLGYHRIHKEIMKMQVFNILLLALVAGVAVADVYTDIDFQFED